MPKAGVTTTRRPRAKDRTEQIVQAATKLFSQRGYHSVSLQDIGDKVGLDASSLYFHFPNKEGLLAAVLTGLIESYDEAYAETEEEETDPEARLVRLADQFLRPQITHQHYFIATDLHEVPRPLARELAQRNRDATQRGVDPLLEVHPQLEMREARCMIAAVSCLTLSLTYYRPVRSKTRLIDVLTRVELAALFVRHTGEFDVRLEHGTEEEAVPPRVREYARVPSSYREQIVGEALRLFRAKGYLGTGVDDIAEAAGITGPGVYRHFENKDEILQVLLTRANDALMELSATSLELASGPRDALDRYVGGYLDLCIERGDVLGVYWSQAKAIPGERGGVLGRERRAFVRDWVGVLLDVRPDLDETDATMIVYAAIGMMNSYWHLTDRHLLPGQSRAILRSMVLNALLNTGAGS